MLAALSFEVACLTRQEDDGISRVGEREDSGDYNGGSFVGRKQSGKAC